MDIAFIIFIALFGIFVSLVRKIPWVEWYFLFFKLGGFLTFLFTPELRPMPYIFKEQ